MLLQVCNECQNLDRGKIDPNDQNFYCAGCWFAYYGEKITPVKETKQKKKKKKISEEGSKQVPEERIIPSNVYGHGSYYRAQVNHTLKESLYQDERYDNIVGIILAFVHQKFVSYTIQSPSKLGIHWNKSSTDDSLLIVHGFQKLESAARAAGVEVGLELVSINDIPIKTIHVEVGRPRRNLEDYYQQLRKKGPVNFTFRRIFPVPLDNEEYYWEEKMHLKNHKIYSSSWNYMYYSRGGAWLLKNKNGEVFMQFNDGDHEELAIRHFVRWQEMK